MFKHYVAKLKSILGGKSKLIPASPAVKVKEFKPKSIERKVPAHETSAGTNHPRVQRKKETVEEYRLRREKRKQEQPRNPRPERIIPSDPWDASLFKVPVADGKTRFQDFDISDQILHAVFDLGFRYCTPVQAETLARSLADEDVTVQAQTGTGKTAAFLITIFDRFLKNPADKKRRYGTPRALILAPTRELVLQIEKDARGLGKYVPCSILSLLGGMDYEKQQRILRNEPCDILICTPGRLLDFMKKRLVDLGKVEILIIDEADRMLDMGFIPSVKQIVLKTPQKAKRQTMFFTATVSTDVKNLSASWTKQAIEITVQPEEIAVQSIEQITYITTIAEKPTLLYNLIMQKNLKRVLVFVNRRSDARWLKETFETYGIKCALLSGDVEQTQRIKRLESFRDGKVRVLVATDVASRGIHVEAISHVINYNMPQDAEEYVHRIGRTGRAGATGISINFADEDDSHELQKVEEFLGKKIEYIFPDESLLIPIPDSVPKKVRREPRKNSSLHARRYNKGPQRRK